MTTPPAEPTPAELTDELAVALRSLVLGPLRAALGPDHDLTATVAVTDEGFEARVDHEGRLFEEFGYGPPPAPPTKEAA